MSTTSPMRAVVQAAKTAMSPAGVLLVGAGDASRGEWLQRIPVAQREGPGFVEFVFGQLVLALPPPDPGGVDGDEPVADGLLHDPDENREAVPDGGAVLTVGDPGQGPVRGRRGRCRAVGGPGSADQVARLARRPRAWFPCERASGRAGGGGPATRTRPPPRARACPRCAVAGPPFTGGQVIPCPRPRRRGGAVPLRAGRRGCV
jgi:hypothetical protein